MAMAKCWDLSTGYVTKEDADKLNSGNLENGRDGVRTARHEYGWVVFVAGDWDKHRLEAMRANEWSARFIKLYRTASREGVSYIVFDVDGEDDERFKREDW